MVAAKGQERYDLGNCMTHTGPVPKRNAMTRSEGRGGGGGVDGVMNGSQRVRGRAAVDVCPDPRARSFRAHVLFLDTGIPTRHPLSRMSGQETSCPRSDDVTQR